MKIAVCLDDKNGMLFAGRRQSMDRVLREAFLELAEDTEIWMDAYTAGQFQEDQSRIRVDEQFLEKAGEDDWCFVEKADLSAVADQVNAFAVYRWNRTYPSDVKFPADLFVDRWKLISSREFAGSSHEKITEEVYSL